MTAGDFSSKSGSIANGATVDIKPTSSGEIWNLKGITVSVAFTLYKYVGAQVTVETYPQGTVLNDLFWQVDENVYYQITNNSGGSGNYSYEYGVLK
jgi:hypothetical protein